MFYGCHNFDSNLSSWNVRNVFNMNWMFYDCQNFTADLNDWDVFKVKMNKNIWHMFTGCKKLFKKRPLWSKK